MEYNLNESESIILLAYLCYGIDGFDQKEIKVLGQTVQEFYSSEGEIDLENLISRFDILIDENDLYELLDLALSNIRQAIHEKVFIYLADGIFCDREITKTEVALIGEISEKMNIDFDFHMSIISVMRVKNGLSR